jgi:regulator of sirC expression with transglutaminase-like and TPR domain
MAPDLTPDSSLRNFAALVGPAREDESIPLAAAALAIARMEYPDLDPAPYLARLDDLAQQVRTRMRKNPTARESIVLLNHVLFSRKAYAAIAKTFTTPETRF